MFNKYKIKNILFQNYMNLKHNIFKNKLFKNFILKFLYIYILALTSQLSNLILTI